MEPIDPDRLMEDHKNLVFHLIARFIPETSLREDIFQDVFLNVFRSLPTFAGKSKLSTWIASVAVNTCYSHIRKIVRDRKTSSLEAWMEEGDETPVAIRSSPDEAGRGESRGTLEARLDRLPPKYKVPIQLFYFEGFAYEDIAETLNIPVGTVKTHLFRGLKRLREEMQGDPS
ncbi:MAG: RNA polymerase sigma factor [Candidatus Aminicenantes bacterium]|nr:RNA polymerase sigma factor [Candidatus Aminicenantes bacterium]